jgi:hypothetical protein
LKAQGYLNNGINEGNWVYYYEDGNIEGQCNFENGAGEFTGFYPSGRKKLIGTIDNDKKVGTWELYDESGELSGYYKPYYEESQPRNTNVPVVNNKVYGIADFLFKGKRFTYFEEGINEFKGVIVGGNPLLSFFGIVPISLEFYLQERMGYEFEFVVKRNPFYKSDQRIPINELYTRGNAIAVRQKFYDPDGGIGMWYFGHGVYFENLSHFVNDATIIPNEIISLTASEQRIEWAPMLGYRYMPRTYEKGFTIDIYLGYGIGYRNININDNDRDKFIDLSDNKFSNTIRAGLNVGYVFATEKHGNYIK